MKKLIVAAFAVCAAFATHAAAVTWTTTAKVYGPTADSIANMKNGDVLALGTTSSEYIKNIALTWSAEVTFTKSGTKETVTLTSWDYSSNKIKAADFEATTFDGLGDDPVAISWSIIITGKKENGDYITSNVLTGSDNFTKLSEPTFSTVAPTSWTATVATTPTPEPTSGLLLLLGMAGIALKRKRA